MNKYIINDNHEIRPTNDLLEWAENQGRNHLRRVAETFVGETRISTVFLGLDHSFSADSDEPILFETMAFNGPLDQEQERCSTWEQAVTMHEKMVERVKEAQKEQ